MVTLCAQLHRTKFIQLFALHDLACNENVESGTDKSKGTYVLHIGTALRVQLVLADRDFTRSVQTAVLHVSEPKVVWFIGSVLCVTN